MEVISLATELRNHWVNGNRDDVIRKLGVLDPIVAAAVTARMVLLLHDEHYVPTDLALFTSRLEADAYAK